MTEKRFRANFDVSIYDSEKEEYISASGRGLEEIAKIMNEQQATIDKLRVDIRATRTTIRKLQDLCGKSDGENAKLRIENKKLKAENEQLRQTIKDYEYQIKKGYTDLTYEEMLEKECENDE